MARNWSIQKLADAIGMSKMSVSDIERGNTLLNVHHMRKFADALDCDPSDLLSQDDNPNRPTQDELTLLQSLRAANKETREQVIKMAAAILPPLEDLEDENEKNTA